MRTVPLLATLRQCVLRHAGRSDAAALSGLALMRADTPTQPFLHMCEPTFALVLQGRARTVLGDATFDCGPGQYLVFPVDLPVQGSVVAATAATPFLALRLALRPESIAALLLDGGIPAAVADAPTGIAVSHAPADVLDALVRLLRMLDVPADVPVLAAALEREVLWRLINGAQGALVRQIGLANSRMAQIVRASRQLREHYERTVPVEELAAMVGMSVTSLHRHFRAITSMTPLQYQKQVRLQVARERLLARAEDVAAVAFAVGYGNPSQFSREYRRLFGQPPGRDGQRLRDAVDPALPG
jgi:AraC-like DNA-binding protein